MRVTVTYDEIRRTAVRAIKCQRCGKRLRRQKTFGQIMNPWNKNKAGIPKSYGEIWKELGEECAVWQPGPVLCVHCDQVELVQEENQ